MIHSTIPSWILVAALVGMVLANGCAAPAQPQPMPVEAAPEPTPTPVEVEAAPEPTPTPVEVEPTPEPTPTPVEVEPTPEPTPTPVEATPEPTPEPESAPERTGISVDLEALFPPPAEMREMVLNNCTNCHTFVPIVVLQLDADEWITSLDAHREYVTALSEEERQAMYDYLIENFNPDTPVPELPPALLETWTSY